jgi:hypothetical protein
MDIFSALAHKWLRTGTRLEHNPLANKNSRLAIFLPYHVELLSVQQLEWLPKCQCHPILTKAGASQWDKMHRDQS